MSKAKKTANPFKTRNDRLRLGPLSMRQLQDLRAREGRGRTRAKIQNRIDTLVRRGVPVPVPVKETGNEST